jgi:hypothetical protein
LLVSLQAWAGAQAGADPVTSAATGTTASNREPSFIRFVPDGARAGRLETSVKRYRNGDGIQVTLFAAVHVGDAAYYRNLQRRFEGCDALLYEMIRDTAPDEPFQAPEGGGGGGVGQLEMVGFLQSGMKRLLELEFQLDAIDYSRKNFVHADLDPDTFFRLQEERQESLLGLMFRVMLEEQARLNAGQGSTVDGMGLLLALMNPDRGYALKLVLGRQMDQIEAMLAGVEKGPSGQESVIVGARNEHAMKVLEEQIRLSRRRLGIFYGAAHMPDFERRLKKLGFEEAGEEWVPAWDIRPKRAESVIPPESSSGVTRD